MPRGSTLALKVSNNHALTSSRPYQHHSPPQVPLPRTDHCLPLLMSSPQLKCCSSAAYTLLRLQVLLCCEVSSVRYTCLPDVSLSLNHDLFKKYSLISIESNEETTTLIEEPFPPPFFSLWLVQFTCIQLPPAPLFQHQS